MLFKDISYICSISEKYDKYQYSHSIYSRASSRENEEVRMDNAVYLKIPEPFLP
jgi:hypothetical protein